MRRTLPFLVLMLAVSLSVLAQHSGGGSSGSGSSGGSSSGGGGGGSHSSASSGGGGGGGSSHSSSSSASSESQSSSASGGKAGGLSTGSPSYSGGTRAGNTHGGSRVPPAGTAHEGKQASKPPVRVPGQPPEKNPKQGRRLFAFLSPHAVTKPPCRGKNCAASCPAGQVATKSGSCRAAPGGEFSNCTTYDPPGSCLGSSTFYRCSAPSAAIIAEQQREVDRLLLARESTCSQSPMSQACADLTQWYGAARERLEQLRAQARRCL